MVNVAEVAEKIYMIDNDLYSIPEAGSVYFIDEDKKALIDTGPATSCGVVIEGIKRIGRKPEDISYIIVTHIHLDHSGGVGSLLKSMPDTKAVVHHKAVKHVIDPEKLVKSASEAQGETWMIMNGEVIPVDKHRIMSACDGDIITLGDKQVLTLFETPGHAPHELAIFESRNGGVFVGDAVAHHVTGTDISAPITPPPSFNLEQYLRSLDKIRMMFAKRLYFAHFGVSERVEEKIKLAVNELRTRDKIIAKAAAENKIETAADMIIEHVRGILSPILETKQELIDYWMNFDIPMSARAHVEYCLKKWNS